MQVPQKEILSSLSLVQQKKEELGEYPWSVKFPLPEFMKAKPLVETIANTIEGVDVVPSGWLCPWAETTQPAVLAGMYESCSSSPNFDRESNPAACDGEIITTEMVRKLVGLPEDYCLLKNGLGRVVPCEGEAILLSFIASKHSRPKAKQYNLVPLGLPEQSPLRKCLRIHNCIEFGPGIKFDVESLQIAIDQLNSNSKRPHLLYQQISCIADIERVSSLKPLLKQNEIFLYTDCSLLGLHAIEYSTSLSTMESDFYYFNFGPTLGTPLSSGILFMRDRRPLKEVINNPHQEYLEVAHEDKPRSGINANITMIEYNAPDYDIGFTNAVYWSGTFFSMIYYGKEGLHNILKRHTASLKILFDEISKLDIPWERRPELKPNCIEFTLENDDPKNLYSPIELYKSIIESALDFVSGLPCRSIL